MNSKIKLAMFDFDGTLFDTEEANYLAYKLACGDEFPLEREYFAKHCMSRSYKAFLPKLGVPESRLKEIHDKKIRYYKTCLSSVKKNDTLFEIAHLLKAAGAKLCIVTTAAPKNVDSLLELFDCKEMFDLLVTQDTVQNQKPAPDCYLYAMRYYNADPQECVIFEDSETGLAAAQQTGAAVYCIKHF